MKLYTKRGDDGFTELFGGNRVSKNNPRVAAYGDVDETNAALGSALALCDDSEIRQVLLRIQSDLFVLGGELAVPANEPSLVKIDEGDISRLERWIDLASDQVLPLRTFVLPGGTAIAAALHLARSVCRRAERTVVGLSTRETVRSVILVYLNRLSDLLFALARLANHRANVSDIPWVRQTLDESTQ